MDDKWQNAPLDYARAYDNKGKHSDEDVGQFLEKMLPLIEHITSQAGEIDLSQPKKTIIETKGVLSFPREVTEEYQSITDPKIICNFASQPIATCGSKSEPNNLGVLFFSEPSTYVITLFSLLTHNCLGYAVQCEPVATFALLPTENKLAVTANSNGELILHSLRDAGRNDRPLCISYAGHKAAVTNLSVRGSVDNPHFALISSLDSTGTTCFWRLDSTANTETMGSIEEIVIGEYKLQLLERIDLSREFIESVPIGLEIDPKDVNSFIVMAEEKIYRNTRIVTMENMCRKYQFKELLYARPSAMAVSDEGIFLVGFDDGSLGLYSQHYTIPLSIWQNVAEAKIVALKWSSVYFDNISKDAELAMQNMKGGDKKDFASSYKNNLLEFYLIDELSNFQIWNLSKLVNVK